MDKNTAKSYVYLLHALGTNRFKIGQSKSPVKRQDTINNLSSPFPIKLIACYSVPDSYKEEQRLHSEFRSKRVHGEWFEFDSVNQAKELMVEKLGVPEVYLSSVQLNGRLSRLPFLLVDSLGNNQCDKDKINITKEILEEMARVAIEILGRPCKHDYYRRSKISSLQLLTGKYVHEIIYNTFQINPSILVPYPNVTEDLFGLVNEELNFIRDYVKTLPLREQRELDPVRPTFKGGVVGTYEFDNALISVREYTEVLPKLTSHLSRKAQYLRGVYAFSCWVFSDKCQSNEDDFIESLLA